MVELYKSLRILSNIDKDQYLTTNNEGNISGIYDDTLVNNISNTLTGESWLATRDALIKIYTVLLPKEYSDLVEINNQNGLKKLYELLELSIEGLTHLKRNYTYCFKYKIYIETFIEDYSKEYIKKIKDVLEYNDECDEE